MPKAIAKRAMSRSNLFVGDESSASGLEIEFEGFEWAVVTKSSVVEIKK